MNPKIIKLGVWAILLFALSIVAFKMMETVDAKEIVVVQYPNGSLEVYKSSGIKPQLFGSITRYKKSFQYSFYKGESEGDKDESIKVRFNDGGHGQLSGSCRIDMPLDDASILALHIKYGSQDALEADLVRKVLEKSVYMTGPLMSSKESASTKRNDLLTYIADQSEFGVYRTTQKDVRQNEEGSDTARIVTVVDILKDASGLPLRLEKSYFTMYHVGFGNLSIKSLDYDSVVEMQIRNQQQLAMQVQTAMAKAKTAEQQVFTAQKEGEAAAATAKWEQEVIKAQQVTEAQQRLEVQKLAAERAEQYKIEQIRIGEGDGERKRLAMAANGALDAKLEAYITVQKYWADAFSKFQGNLVPLYQSGGASGTNAVDWMQIMGFKAMKDLNLDLTNKK